MTELDADAPSRHWVPMHEFHLFHSVFFHLRAGQLQRARQLAADNGRRYLANALAGCRPCHDLHNASTIGAGFKQPAQGSFYGYLWMRACWRVASSPTCSLYKSAVYGALSGNLQAMLPVCTTWEDQLWARMRAVVDAAVRASETLDIEVTHSVQRGLVLGDGVSLVEEIHDWVTGQPIEPPLLTMRFLAHMALLLGQVDPETRTAAYSALLRTYIQMLIDDGHASLAATCAAAL
ncbi:hypothetical protein HPB51_012151 [Rhipicephalus microplus]|uniref:Nuclear pore complex protein n=1 Tax=Rhipicephalus microplus TaxID=6941 RepID=A0A9J6DUD0_RHIMP|nr:hypothetical protein HPB51_012151 [Rhipicephalus microplus]